MCACMWVGKDFCYVNVYTFCICGDPFILMYVLTTVREKPFFSLGRIKGALYSNARARHWHALNSD